MDAETSNCGFMAYVFEIIEKLVPSEGVEPPCLAALGSKPSVSANSTNWALKGKISAGKKL